MTIKLRDGHIRAVIQAVYQPVLVLNPNLTVRLANDAFYAAFSLSRADTVDRLVFGLNQSQWNVEPLCALLHEQLRDPDNPGSIVMERYFERGGWRVLHIAARVQYQDRERLLVLTITDVTAHAHAHIESGGSAQQFPDLVEGRAMGNIAHRLFKPIYLNRPSAGEYAYSGITDDDNVIRALQDSEQRFNAVFNSTFHFMGLVSLDGVLLDANQASLDWAEVRAEEVVGRPFWETRWWEGSQENQARLKDAIARAAKGEFIHYAVQLELRDGAVGDFSLQPVTDDAGEVYLLIAEGRDITQQARAEQEAAQRRAELAHCTRLMIMNEMAMGLAHELTGPLTAVANYCTSAVDLLDASVKPPDKLKWLLGQAHEQAQRGGEIIRHLRDFTRLGRSEITLVNYAEVVEQALVFSHFEASDNNVRLNVELGDAMPTVKLDRIQIEQVLVNLIYNAIEVLTRIEGKTGEIWVNVSAQDGSIETTVRDNGPGLSETMIDTVFQPFHTTKADGLGLGLAISRAIVESHGGELWVESSLGEGSTFHFTIPIAVAEWSWSWRAP